ncbi:uncharacterized protein K452DRAFT_315766 [Aplosporella prunicola CBS 121167]|uniref:F-box domain-containing protein n=1 Tax=Aplosporella prunicola CBS 121167 TaxID=1176127 RepID=A0A6A6BQ19_9PEZI|nr:uncharacterized protein K452DRAFT_315766 [Aplosporella prunicola CBS 121167]KAF2145543.1 hypothetical protein K452DRAFT_315766 [Aplosporella prunicola CBS 121167]
MSDADVAALPPLLRLPKELLDLIISHLDFPGLTHLRATCRTTTGIIPAQEWNHATLAAAEDSAWAARFNRLACKWCAHMRLATRFTDMHKLSKRRGSRACVDCLLPWDEGPFWDPDLGRGAGNWNWGCCWPRDARRTRLSAERRLVAVEEGVKGWAGSNNSHPATAAIAVATATNVAKLAPANQPGF